MQLLLDLISISRCVFRPRTCTYTYSGTLTGVFITATTQLIIEQCYKNECWYISMTGVFHSGVAVADGARNPGLAY